MTKRQDCSNPSVQLTSNSKLPDPFLLTSGQRITTKEQWTSCRRAEILSLLQQYESGDLPPKPSTVTGSFSGDGLTINVSEGGSSASFSVTISKPSGSGPFPAIIAYGFPSIPIPNGVATITFSNDALGAQNGVGSRGQGVFFDLYGSQHSASSITAWSWGVSRIIDALESTPDAGIDPTKIGVTGCSRNGKGAIFAGALDERIALTIPQESGSGGAACWRLSDEQQRRGQNVQTASQIITENPWFSTRFDQFGQGSVNNLPFDHHSLAALVAPRGLLVIENTSMEWLGSWSTYGCMRTAQEVYKALGVQDHMGYSQVGHGNHCSFPSNQQPELTAFIQKFLLDDTSANTSVMKSDGNHNFDLNEWAGWSTPTLS